MKNRRRDFIKWTSLAGLGVAGGVFSDFSSVAHTPGKPVKTMNNNNPADHGVNDAEEKNVSIIGGYGAWAASLETFGSMSSSRGLRNLDNRN